jgi:hypothetical protein
MTKARRKDNREFFCKLRNEYKSLSNYILKERKDKPLSDFKVIVITRCWNWERRRGSSRSCTDKSSCRSLKGSYEAEQQATKPSRRRERYFSKHEHVCEGEFDLGNWQWIRHESKLNSVKLLPCFIAACCPVLTI